jgi:hypothetical protein
MAARKRQMHKQWSSKHTPTTKDRVTTSGSPAFFPGCYSIFSCRCMFWRSLFVHLSLSGRHCVICPSLIYGFWLPPFGIFKLFLLHPKIASLFPFVSKPDVYYFDNSSTGESATGKSLWWNSGKNSIMF